MARKLALVFNWVELVDTEDQYTHAESSFLLRMAGSVLHLGTLAPLALLGVWISWPQRARLLPLYAMFAVYGATLLLFYIFGRYRLPLVPFAVLFAAAGLVGIRGSLRTAGAREIAACLAACAALALFCRLPLSDPHTMRSVTHYNIGNALVADGRVEAAKDHFRQAIRLHADNAVANHNLGAILAREGDLGGARAHFEAAIRIAPGYAQARFNLARALAEAGQPISAIDSYERGLAIEPNRADVLVELAEVQLETGEIEAAAQTYERARQLDPDLVEARRIQPPIRRDVEAGTGPSGLDGSGLGSD
jgi:tetratricopeptide (TPR) repeat protein